MLTRLVAQLLDPSAHPFRLLFEASVLSKAKDRLILTKTVPSRDGSKNQTVLSFKDFPHYDGRPRSFLRGKQIAKSPLRRRRLKNGALSLGFLVCPPILPRSPFIRHIRQPPRPNPNWSTMRMSGGSASASYAFSLKLLTQKFGRNISPFPSDFLSHLTWFCLFFSVLLAQLFRPWLAWLGAAREKKFSSHRTNDDSSFISLRDRDLQLSSSRMMN